MDIATQAEILLRSAGYDTWSRGGAAPVVTCFENAALIGFLHVFPSAGELLNSWESAQQSVLSRHSTALRAAGAKAWNVYSVFLAEETDTKHQREVERIEEDFSLTRKIARAGVRTHNDLEHALMPLLGVKAKALLVDSDFEDRLRLRLKSVSPDVIAAFLGSNGATEVAEMLGEKQ